MASEIFDLRDISDKLRVFRRAYIDSCPGGSNRGVALVNIDGMDGVSVDLADIEISCQTLQC